VTQRNASYELRDLAVWIGSLCVRKRRRAACVRVCVCVCVWVCVWVGECSLLVSQFSGSCLIYRIGGAPVCWIQYIISGRRVKCCRRISVSLERWPSRRAPAASRPPCPRSRTAPRSPLRYGTCHVPSTAVWTSVSVVSICDGFRSFG
jgi:hypothetical protein